MQTKNILLFFTVLQATSDIMTPEITKRRQRSTTSNWSNSKVKRVSRPSSSLTKTISNEGDEEQKEKEKEMKTNNCIVDLEALTYYPPQNCINSKVFHQDIVHVVSENYLGHSEFLGGKRHLDDIDLLVLAACQIDNEEENLQKKSNSNLYCGNRIIDENLGTFKKTEL